MCRHSTSDVRSWSKASMNSMLISRFGSRSSLRKFHRTCFLGVYIKQDLLQLEVQFKASLVGCTSHAFFIQFLILVAHTRFGSFMGLFIIWEGFCSYQLIKEKKTTTTSTTKQKANKIDVNVQTCHFVQANEITAVGFVALTNRILALRLHFVQVQIYCCWRSVTLLNMPYSIFASFQKKVSLNGNFPYRFFFVIEKYQI